MTTPATLLYIEDDDASRNLVQRVLTYSGYKVLIATRALEGIDLAKKHQPDLILTDINLPDLSGREIIVRLRADPRLATVPIVALTAQQHAASDEAVEMERIVLGIEAGVGTVIQLRRQAGWREGRWRQ